MIEVQPGLFINPEAVEQITVDETSDGILVVAARFTSGAHSELRGEAAEALLAGRGIPLPGG